MIDRRQSILDAALHCFVEAGYRATSIADIRARSGASTGSIYHFFSGKGDLAEALFARAIAGWSDASGVAGDLAGPAEASIKASVSGLVVWGLTHPGEAAFLDEMRVLASPDNELAKIAERLAAGHAASEHLYARFSERGEVRPLPWRVAHALMLGPAYSYLRLAGRAAGHDRDAAPLLAEAAWQAVRANP